MPQERSWDREYKANKLITGSAKPQAFFLKYLRFLKKLNLEVSDLTILDLGSGTGKNSHYLALLGAKVHGMEISKTAISIAKKRAQESHVTVEYVNKSIGELYPFPDSHFDVVIDIMSSNSLAHTEREVYINEVQRILRPGGRFFVRALLKDGDKNAQNLLKKFPGPEKDTYRMPKVNIIERVFTERDFLELYEGYFEVEKIIKTTSYTRVENINYKRNYIIGYLKKPNQ
jgi:2-polyprenyl-3-methyl-5-hydroxy-6-metoxy-1,4-benzoquinol methylase